MTIIVGVKCACNRLSLSPVVPFLPRDRSTIKLGGTHTQFCRGYYFVSSQPAAPSGIWIDLSCTLFRWLASRWRYKVPVLLGRQILSLPDFSSLVSLLDDSSTHRSPRSFSHSFLIPRLDEIYSHAAQSCSYCSSLFGSTRCFWVHWI